MNILTYSAAIAATGFVLFFIMFKNISEVKRCTKRNRAPFWIILLLIGFILLAPFLIALLCICAFYRQGVNLILKIKHGSKFAGLLQGTDGFHAADEPSQSVTHCLLIVHCVKKCSPDEFFERMRKVIWKVDQHSKFKMSFRKCFGYSYMLKGEVTMNDCIKKMKTINCHKNKVDKAEFLTLLHECCNAPMPKSGTQPWEVLIGTQPVNWKEGENQYYPLLFRFNHAVADGVTLMKLMVGTLADKEGVEIASQKSSKKTEENKNSKKVPVSSNIYPDSNMMEKETLYISTEYLNHIATNLHNRTRKALELFMTVFYVLLLTPASLIVNLILKGNDCNILRGPPLTGEKILALSTEESHEYVQKIKRIKNKVPGASFPDVLLTAFSASLTDYFEKYSTCPPEYITAAIPVLSGSSEISRLIPGEFEVNSLTIGNGYSLLLMNLPIACQHAKQFTKNTPLVNRIKLLNEESNILKNSVDYLLNYFAMSILCSLLPRPLLKFISTGMRCSVSVTSMAGPPKLTYGEGSVVLSDLEGWVPHLHNVGTTLCVNTYDGRLQIGLSADKGVIADQDAAQSIVDGIYKHLDLLEKEVDSVYLKNE